MICFAKGLDELINPRHPLAQLARQIDRVTFERKSGLAFSRI
jgi:hypothetical protein